MSVSPFFGREGSRLERRNDATSRTCGQVAGRSSGCRGPAWRNTSI